MNRNSLYNYKEKESFQLHCDSTRAKFRDVTVVSLFSNISKFKCVSQYNRFPFLVTFLNLDVLHSIIGFHF